MAAFLFPFYSVERKLAAFWLCLNRKFNFHSKGLDKPFFVVYNSHVVNENS